MNAELYGYLMLFLQFLILLPSAILCYLPMHHCFRFSVKKTVVFCLLIFLPYDVIASGVCVIWNLNLNLILIPSFVLFFLFYYRSIRTAFPCALAVFMDVCTLMTFTTQFSHGFDAWLYLIAGENDVSFESNLFQLAISFLLCGILAVPCWKYYSRLVDQLSTYPVWYPFLAIHIVIFIFNMMMTPNSYATLYTGRVFPMFIALETVMLLLFLLLHLIFFHIADAVQKHAELIQRSRFLEMQAEQYQTLQNYMLQTKQLRHDFRQSVHILSALAEEGNLSGLQDYLHQYEQRLDAETPVSFCANAALNALFNYYKDAADTQGIRTAWQISLPQPLTISELDMASLLGNLMENAIAGCVTAPEGERRFALSVEARQNSLYIVSTNSFNGNPRTSAGEYLSTKRAGEGLGLLSISSVAKKYQGYARMSHKGTEFFVDVMLKI